MSFRVIRVSSDYRLVILVSPEDAGPEDKCENFIYNTVVYEKKEIIFEKCTKMTAACYLGGQADGLGFGEAPDVPFESLQEAVDWTKRKREQCDKELLQQAESSLEKN